MSGPYFKIKNVFFQGYDIFRYQSWGADNINRSLKKIKI